MQCSLCGFLIIKPQTTLYHAVRCTVTCGMVWCGYAILWAVLVQFGEHS